MNNISESQIIMIYENEYLLKNNNIYTLTGELYGNYDTNSNKIISSKFTLIRIINWLEYHLDNFLKILFIGNGVNIIKDHFKSNKKFVFNNDNFNICIFSKCIDNLNNIINTIPDYGYIIIRYYNDKYYEIKNLLELNNITIINDEYMETKKHFFICGQKSPNKIFGNIMFLDTETTGFPSSNDPTDIVKFNNARLVELGYLIYDTNGIKINEYSSLVIPDNFIITNDHIHGITTNDALTKGLQLENVLGQLFNDLKNIDTIVCHNITFDMKILLSESYRNKNMLLFDLIKSKNKLCTMELGKEYMKISKYPKLIELFKFIYNKEVIQDHRSLSDCILCADCYYKMC